MLKSKFSSEHSNLATSFDSSGRFKINFQQNNEQNLNANFQSTNNFKTDFDKSNDMQNVLKLLKQYYAKVYQDTKKNWDRQDWRVGEKNTIYVYTNNTYFTDSNGKIKTIPAIKIGDGETLLIETPFVNEDKLMAWQEHINNTAIHTTNEEKLLWNQKVSAFVSDEDNETLVLSKVLFKLEDIY